MLGVGGGRDRGSGAMLGAFAGRAGGGNGRIGGKWRRIGKANGAYSEKGTAMRLILSLLWRTVVALAIVACLLAFALAW